MINKIKKTVRIFLSLTVSYHNQQLSLDFYIFIYFYHLSIPTRLSSMQLMEFGLLLITTKLKLVVIFEQI